MLIRRAYVVSHEIKLEWTSKTKKRDKKTSKIGKTKTKKIYITQKKEGKGNNMYSNKAI